LVAPPGWSVLSSSSFVFQSENDEALWTTDPATSRTTPPFNSNATRGEQLMLVSSFDTNAHPSLVEQVLGSTNLELRVFSLEPGSSFGTFERLISDASLPAHSYGIADGGHNANGTVGGYTGVVSQFLVLTEPTTTNPKTLLEIWDYRNGGHVTSTQDLGALIAPSTGQVGLPACGFYGGLAHDPASRSILFADPCNKVVWVAGYTAELGQLSIKSMLQPPGIAALTRTATGYYFAPARLAYDPVRHILWSGEYGIPVDLSTL
jgi:hypothetical protein